jgi:hypothetical protein
MLQVPSGTELTALAARGGDSQGRDATKIPRLVRWANLSARAAFALALWSRVDFAADNCPCSLCGALASGFCDSCHFRVSPSNPPPFAVCTTCDVQENRVCRVCKSAGWTQEMCQRQFQREFPTSAANRGMVLHGAHGPTALSVLPVQSKSTSAECRFDSEVNALMEQAPAVLGPYPQKLGLESTADFANCWTSGAALLEAFEMDGVGNSDERLVALIVFNISQQLATAEQRARASRVLAESRATPQPRLLKPPMTIARPTAKVMRKPPPAIRPVADANRKEPVSTKAGESNADLGNYTAGKARHLGQFWHFYETYLLDVASLGVGEDPAALEGVKMEILSYPSRLSPGRLSQLVGAMRR